MQSRRDAGITALVLGFFASAWFGWGQAAAPAGLGAWLTAGSVLALVVAAVGAFVGFRSRAATAALHDRAAGRRYGVIVGIEFGLAGLGAGILGATGQDAYIPVWVCAVVGVHLLPLAPLLHDRRLVALGVLITIVAVVALVAGVTHTVSPSTVTGVGAGLLLLTFAIAELAGAMWPGWRRRRSGGGSAVAPARSAVRPASDLTEPQG